MLLYYNYGEFLMTKSASAIVCKNTWCTYSYPEMNAFKQTWTACDPRCVMQKLVAVCYILNACENSITSSMEVTVSTSYNGGTINTAYIHDALINGYVS